MYRYILTQKCPEKALVQHLDTDDFDYSQYASVADAWDVERNEYWVLEHEGGEDAAREEFEASLHSYDRNDVLAQAEGGASWPLRLGFALEIVDDESDDPLDR